MRHKYSINLREGTFRRLCCSDCDEKDTQVLSIQPILKDMAGGIDTAKLHNQLIASGINVITIRGQADNLKLCFACEIVIDEETRDFSDDILKKLFLLKEAIQ